MINNYEIMINIENLLKNKSNNKIILNYLDENINTFNNYRLREICAKFVYYERKILFDYLCSKLDGIHKILILENLHAKIEYRIKYDIFLSWLYEHIKDDISINNNIDIINVYYILDYTYYICEDRVLFKFILNNLSSKPDNRYDLSFFLLCIFFDDETFNEINVNQLLKINNLNDLNFNRLIEFLCEKKISKNIREKLFDLIQINNNPNLKKYLRCKKLKKLKNYF